MKKWILIFSTMWLCACDPLGGTDTGNPKNTYSGAPTDGQQPAQPMTSLLLDLACDQVALCHPEVTSEACYSSAADLTTIAPKWGLTANSTPNVHQLILWETEDLINVDPGALADCAQAVRDLTCSDPTMQNAVNTSLGGNAYQDFAEVFAPSCAGAFYF